MNRGRKGQKGLDRLTVPREDRRAHKRRLRERGDAPRATAPEADPVRLRLLAILDDGLVELGTLRTRYGAHRDFDLVESHQRKLIESLEREGARACSSL